MDHIQRSADLDQMCMNQPLKSTHTIISVFAGVTTNTSGTTSPPNAAALTVRPGLCGSAGRQEDNRAESEDLHRGYGLKKFTRIPGGSHRIVCIYKRSWIWMNFSLFRNDFHVFRHTNRVRRTKMILSRTSAA